jgi:hypothetical protein
VLQRVHRSLDRRGAACGVLGMHRHPPAHGVHGGHDLAQNAGGKRGIPGQPVSDHLGPAGQRRLHRRQLRELGVVSAPSPPVEELAVLGNPRPGVHRARNIVVAAEPDGRITC